MNRILSLILLLVIFTGALAGCGSQQAKIPVAKPVSSGEDAGREDGFPRTYVDAKGHTVVLEKRPERIAIVFFHLMDTMFTLGTPPVAAPQLHGFMSEWESLKPYLAVNPVIDLGRQTSVNLERVLEVQPDLIIGGSLNEGIYRDLSRIAPVVLLDTQELTREWRTIPREVAKLIGKEAVAEQRIIQLEQMIAQSRDRLAPYKHETFAFVTLDDKGTIFVFGSQSLPAFFDTESGLGLQTPVGYPEKIGRFSLERLAELNPDHIFLKSNKGIETRLERLSDNAIWHTLKAVKNKNIYFLDQSVFTAGVLAVEYGVASVVESLSK